MKLISANLYRYQNLGFTMVVENVKVDEVEGQSSKNAAKKLAKEAAKAAKVISRLAYTVLIQYYLFNIITYCLESRIQSG